MHSLTDDSLVLDLVDYYKFMRRLITKGDLYGKTEPVYAYKLPNLTFTFQDMPERKATVEMKRGTYITFKQSCFSAETAERQMKDIARYWGDCATGSETTSPSYELIGAEIVSASDFQKMYKESETQNLYTPDVEGQLLAVRAPMGTILATQDGIKVLSEESIVAVPHRDVEPLADSIILLKSVGEISLPKIRRALLKKTGSAAFDVQIFPVNSFQDKYDKLATAPCRPSYERGETSSLAPRLIP